MNIYPPPISNTFALPQQSIPMTSQYSYLVTWNASSPSHGHEFHLRPCYKYTYTSNNHAYTINRTNRHKSTKHIQGLFSYQKLLLYNKHDITWIMHRRTTYKDHLGGRLTLLHNNYAFFGNVLKYPLQPIYHHYSG